MTSSFWRWGVALILFGSLARLGQAAGLPEPKKLERLCRSIAMLEAILSPDWESRYYSFDCHFGAGERLASMRNGSGDDWYILRRGSQVFVKGCDHEQPQRPELLRKVPAEFTAEIRQPALATREVTFLRWWLHGKWAAAGGDSGMLKLLSSGRPEAYHRWAVDYYERPIALQAVRQIYARSPLTQGLITSLNPKLKMVDLRKDMEAIGY